MKKIDSNKIINFLNSKWQGSTCPMCHAGNWNVSNKVFELREFNNGDLVIGGPSNAITPVVPVICSNCGNTIFINVLSTGLLKE